MTLCQFCEKRESIEGTLDAPICYECLKEMFDQVMKEGKKVEEDNEEDKKKDAIELLGYMIYAASHSTHFHIEGINMVKWTDDKIIGYLTWVKEKLQQAAKEGNQ